MSEVDAHEDRIREMLVDTALRGISDFGQVVRLMEGASPQDVLRVLPQLTSKFSVFEDMLEGFKKQNLAIASQVEVRRHDWLAAPHPLDYDWRFLESARQMIVSEIGNYVDYVESISVLGAPSIIPNLVDSFPDAVITSYDSNLLTIEAIKKLYPSVGAYLLDLVRGECIKSLNQSDVVIADPPWYPEDIRGFLWSASTASKKDGLVLCSFPGRGTRPTAFAECADLIEYAMQVGLELQKFISAGLRYLTPPFEKNALGAAGIHRIPMDWRAGDLAIFQKKGQNRVQRPHASYQSQWLEVNLQGVRIKIRDKPGIGNDPRLRTLLQGDVLDSVSRRDSRIQNADVWTIGNRIFACDCPRQLHLIATRISHEWRNESNSHESEVREQLLKLVDIELTELATAPCE